MLRKNFVFSVNILAFFFPISQLGMYNLRMDVCMICGYLIAKCVVNSMVPYISSRPQHSLLARLLSDYVTRLIGFRQEIFLLNCRAK